MKSGIDLLADYVFLSKYSQKKDNGELESWDETIDRIYEMHKVKLNKLGLLQADILEMLNKSSDLEKQKRILSSQRGRQFASSKETRRKMSDIKKIQYIGRKWITNGECEKFVNINNGLPQGYYLGRLKKVQIKKKMKKRKVKIILKDGGQAPIYATERSSGADVKANEDFVINPKERKMIHTGIYMELPEDMEVQVRPRSGLAIKHGITCVNAPGTK